MEKNANARNKNENPTRIDGEAWSEKTECHSNLNPKVKNPLLSDFFCDILDNLIQPLPDLGRDGNDLQLGKANFKSL